MANPQGVKLPEGFQLDEEPGAGTGGLPEGYQLDVTGNRFGSTDFPDAPRRAVPVAGPSGAGEAHIGEQAQMPQVTPGTTAYMAKLRLRAMRATEPPPTAATVQAPLSRYGKFAPPSATLPQPGTTAPMLPDAAAEAVRATVRDASQQAGEGVEKYIGEPLINRPLRALGYTGPAPVRVGHPTVPVTPWVEAIQTARENIVPGMAERVFGPRGAQAGDAISMTLGRTLESFTNPEMLGLGPILKEGQTVLQALASIGFSLDMAMAAYETVPAFEQAVNSGDVVGSVQLATELLSSGTLATLAGAHGATGAVEAVGEAPGAVRDFARRAAPFSDLTEATGRGFEGYDQPQGLTPEQQRIRALQGRFGGPEARGAPAAGRPVSPAFAEPPPPPPPPPEEAPPRVFYGTPEGIVPGGEEGVPPAAQRRFFAPEAGPARVGIPGSRLPGGENLVAPPERQAAEVAFEAQRRAAQLPVAPEYGRPRPVPGTIYGMPEGLRRGRMEPPRQLTVGGEQYTLDEEPPAPPEGVVSGGGHRPGGGPPPAPAGNLPFREGEAVPAGREGAAQAPPYGREPGEGGPPPPPAGPPQAPGVEPPTLTEGIRRLREKRGQLTEDEQRQLSEQYERERQAEGAPPRSDHPGRALWDAAHSIEGADRRWAELRAKGATATELQRQLASEFGSWGGYSGPDPDVVAHERKGGMNPKVSYGTGEQKGRGGGKWEGTLQGTKLIATARRVLDIPEPGGKASGRIPPPKPERPGPSAEELKRQAEGFRPATPPKTGIEAANKYVNLLTRSALRRFGFDYIDWLKNGGVGVEPPASSPQRETIQKRILKLLGPEPFKAAGAIGGREPEKPAAKPPVAPDEGLLEPAGRGPTAEEQGFTIGGFYGGTEKPAEKPAQGERVIPASMMGTGEPGVTEARTERGTKVKLRWAVVPAQQLVASHDANGEPNPAYPKELQPRDRSRVASKAQVDEIARNLAPELLDESAKASDGAPIVGDDAVVESGNGRVAAIRRAYELGKAKDYKAHVEKRARALGIDTDHLPLQPVLVRVRRPGGIDRAEFARQANEAGVAAMSATEQAGSDAKRMSNHTLDLLAPDDLDAPGNRHFVQAFMREVVGPTDQGRYVDSQGRLSQEGVRRMQNAILTRAYGEPEAIEKMIESTDSGVKNVAAGLLRAAPNIATMEAGIKAGELHPVSINKDLTDALLKLSALRKQGMSVSDYIAQQGMFGDELSPEARKLLVALDESSRSAKRVHALLRAYAEAAEKAGSPKQGGFVAGKPVTRGELLDVALKKAGEAYDEGEQGKLLEPTTPFEGRPKREAKAESVDELAARLKQKHGLRELDLRELKNGDVRIDLIAVPKGEQGMGRGSAAMEEITAWADRNGRRLTLGTSGKEWRGEWGTTSEGRLRDFYRRFGFVRNRGRNKDFALSIYDTMYREPRGAGRAEEPIEAYHGTGHKFDKFDIEKVGTGEGATVYGHGLYFAENKRVAEEYKRNLGRRYQGEFTKEELDSLPPTLTRAEQGELTGLTMEMSNRLNLPPGEMARWTELHYKQDAYNRAVTDIVEKKSKGHLYTAKIPGEPEAHYLDWDASYSEQTPEVREKLKKVGIEPTDENMEELERQYRKAFGEFQEINLKAADPADVDRARDKFREIQHSIELQKRLADASGEDLYSMVSDRQRQKLGWDTASDRQVGAATSKALHKAGLVGIRYLDQGSRHKEVKYIAERAGKDIGALSGADPIEAARRASDIGLDAAIAEIKDSAPYREGYLRDRGKKILGHLEDWKELGISIRREEPKRTRNRVLFSHEGIDIQKVEEPTKPFEPGVESKRGKTQTDSERQQSLFDDIDGLDPQVLRPGRIPGSSSPAGPGAGVKTVASKIAAAFRKTGRIEFRGQSVESPHDLATIAQIARDPRTETWRVFYVDKDGKVIASEAITSGEPAKVSAFGEHGAPESVEPGSAAERAALETVARQRYEMRQRFERLKARGAVGYYTLHNHPSERSSPSSYDAMLAHRLSHEVSGFLGDVVINSGEYSYATPASLRQAAEDGAFYREKDDNQYGYKTKPVLSSPYPDVAVRPELLLSNVKNVDGIAKIGRSLKTPKNYVTLVYADAGWKTRAVQEMPRNLFLNTKEAANYIRARMRDFGAPSVVAYSGAEGRDIQLKMAARDLISTGKLVDMVWDRAAAEKGAARERGLSSERDAVLDREFRKAKGKEPLARTRVEEPQEEFRTKAREEMLGRVEEETPSRGRKLAEAGKEAARDIADDIHRGLSPGTYGQAAKLMGGALRHHLAEKELARLRAARAAVDSIRALDPLSREEKDAFINRVEKNEKQPTPELQRAHVLARTLLDEGRNELLALGKLKNGFYEHYFPHLWKKPKEVETRLAEFYGRRPFEGSKSFLKKRKYPTYAEGLEAGLQPKFENPIEAVLAHRALVDRYVAAVKTINDGIAEGTVKRVFTDMRPPAGYRKLPDSFGTIYGDRKIPIQEQIDTVQWKALHDLATAIGVRHKREAPAGPKDYFGYTSQGGPVVSRFATGMGTLTHEIGHQLQFKYNLWDYLKGPRPETLPKGERAKAEQKRVAIGKELRALADLRFEGQDTSQYFKDYTRKLDEKMANLVDAYVNHRDRMREVAPITLQAFEEKIGQHPELAQLKKIRPSLNRGSKIDFADAGGTVIRGHLYVPASVVKLFENHLSPGLHGKALYDAFRTAGNSMNQFQLGFSAFHAGFTTLDAMVSKAALGVEQMSRGELGRGALNVVKGISPHTVFENYRRGDKVMREAMSGEMTEDVRRVPRAGGRFGQDQFYQSGMARSFQRSFREGKYGSAAVKAPLAVAELVAKPILEKLVPRQKLGVFLDLAESELKRLGEDATPQERRYALGRAWDSVDNRMGQLVYDNQFWNRTAKDLTMASVRSLGWNVGTLREIGGAGFDIATLAKRLRDKTPGELRDAAFTHRMAYTMALPIVVGVYGATYQYLMTGKGPTETKDYFFPKTGKVNPDGSEERVALPSYMKDVAAYSKQPLTTIGHKLHPLLSTAAEMLQNKDFYGTEIRDPEDSIPAQALQLASHAAKSFLPFSVRGWQRMKEAGDEPLKRLQSGVGIVPAAAYITKSPAQQEMSKYAQEHAPEAPRSHEQAERTRAKRQLESAVRRGDLPGARDVGRRALEKGLLTPSDLSEVEKRLDLSMNQIHFKPLSMDAKLRVWKVATPEEKDELRDLLAKSLVSADSPSGAFSKMTDTQLKEFGTKLRAAAKDDPKLRAAIAGVGEPKDDEEAAQ